MFELGDRVKINDRKLKTHGFSGEVVSVTETIEKSKVYTVNVELMIMDRKSNELKKTNRKRQITVMKNQLQKETNV